MTERAAASWDRQAGEPSSQTSGASSLRGPVARHEHYARPIPDVQPSGPGAGAYAGPRLGHHFGRLRVQAGMPPQARNGSPADGPGDGYEREADRAAEQVMRALRLGGSEAKEKPPEVSRTGLAIQRAPLEVALPTSGAAVTADANRPPVAPGAEPAAGTAPSGLIVEDSAAELGPGEMRKSEFLSRLRDAVCATAEEALAGTEWSTAGCPWIDYWFGYYGNRDSGQIERAIRRYAPEATNATTAAAYIPAISQRVRGAIAVWATTGEVTGVPEGIPAESPGTAPAGGAAAGGVMFKGRDGGARQPGDPRAVQTQLGSGNYLDGGVRSRMQRAFGQDFSRVRVHTDSGAAQLSSNLNARAFAVGEHIAFGPGEYQPGTPVGDALIAHELAHVVQQGGPASSGPLRKGEGGNAALEEDADLSAAGAVASLWSGVLGSLAGIGQKASPGLRSGLRLSRCSKTSSRKKVTVNITHLHDSTGSVASSLTYANDKVYKQADVEVLKGKEATLDETKSKAILGADLVLDEFADVTKPTTEEKALFKENQSAGAVTMYFVKGQSAGNTGEAFPPFAGVGFVGFVVSNAGNDATFSHELGHVLLDGGSHTVPDDTYLMYAAKKPDKYKLTPAQITTIKSSPYVT